MRRHDVTSDTFNVVGICINENQAYEWISKSRLALVCRLKHLVVSRYHTFFSELLLRLDLFIALEAVINKRRPG